MYLHRLIFFVGGFGKGNRGFVVVFFFVPVDAWGEHGGTAVAVGDGVVTPSTLDIAQPLRHSWYEVCTHLCKGGLDSRCKSRAVKAKYIH
jgi:hypothetical protein